MKGEKWNTNKHNKNEKNNKNKKTSCDSSSNHNPILEGDGGVTDGTDLAAIFPHLHYSAPLPLQPSDGADDKAMEGNKKTSNNKV